MNQIVNTNVNTSPTPLGYGEVGEEVTPISPANPMPVRGTTPRVTGSIVRAASATVYAAGDIIAPSPAAPLVFTMPRPAGRISGARAVISVGSGDVVLPALDLLLFRPGANIPFASGGYPADNAVMTITPAAYRELVAVIPFTASAWRNAIGGTSASGLVAYQPGVQFLRPYAPFNVSGLEAQALRGVVQAQSAWNPGSVAYTIDFALDVDCD